MPALHPTQALLAITLALSALAAALGTSPAAAAPCEQTLFDGGGYVFDFEAKPNPPPEIGNSYGAIQDGGSNGPAETPPGPALSSDSYDDWGNLFVFGPGADVSKPQMSDLYDGAADACGTGLAGQELVYPFVPLQGLEVQRRWFVDRGPLGGARALTVLRNPGPMPVEVTVGLGDPTGNRGDLGSDVRTAVLATSSGAPAFSATSYWGVSGDGASDGDPILAHVWDGAGGALRVSDVVLKTGVNPASLAWNWKLIVPPGATRSLISYEIQNVVPGRDEVAETALAVAQAEAREKQSFAALYAGMSAVEIAGTQNWPLPTASAQIAPVVRANAATPVRLDGSKSQATVEGLPQCIPSYSWNTGDGGKGSGSTLAHLFGPGTHRVTLSVDNSCGGSATAPLTIKVARAISLGGARLNRARGTATLRVRALGAGTLTLSGRGVKKQTKRVKRKGGVALPVVPSGHALSKLLRSGHAKVKVTVSFRPRGGKVSKLTKTVSLVRS